ncbi:MAG: hypothetical protein IH869_03525 [Chloroflexi bacterium]|nr:hypothetical protein [Chloroflexota bacterium]
MSPKMLGLVTLPAGGFATGFALGIIPGLLLGLPEWHRAGAVVLPVLWAFGYLGQRSKGFGDVRWVSYVIVAFGGAGLGLSVLTFGGITA